MHHIFSLTDVRTKPIQLRFIHRGSTERYSYNPTKVQPVPTSSFLQPVSATLQQSHQPYHPPRSPCAMQYVGLSSHRSHSQRRGSTPQAMPQILYGALKTPHSAQSSPPGPRSPRLAGLTDPWSGPKLSIRRSSGEMEWLTAPGLPRSRKNSWSSVSTDCDFSPCW